MSPYRMKKMQKGYVSLVLPYDDDMKFLFNNFSTWGFKGSIVMLKLRIIQIQSNKVPNKYIMHTLYIARNGGIIGQVYLPGTFIYRILYYSKNRVNTLLKRLHKFLFKSQCWCRL